MKLTKDKIDYIVSKYRSCEDKKSFLLFIEYIINKVDLKSNSLTKFLNQSTAYEIDIIYNSIDRICKRTKILGDKKLVFAKSLVSNYGTYKGDILLFSYKKEDMYAFINPRHSDETIILYEQEFEFLNTK